MTNCVHILRSLLRRHINLFSKYGVSMKRHVFRRNMHSTGSKT